MTERIREKLQSSCISALLRYLLHLILNLDIVILTEIHFCWDLQLQVVALF